MKQRSNRARQKQINILHTTTRKRHSQKQFSMAVFWTAIVVTMIAAVGVALHFGIDMLLNRVLYTNPHYVVKKIEIEPAGKFFEYTICQATGLKRGENLWTLNLPQITSDLEKLPYVSSAKVERHFPDRVVIRIHERVPVVKIVGINVDLGTRETFYLDRECIVLKPREDEPPPSPPLPEVIGLTNAELEPGVRLQQPVLASALKILDAINLTSELHTSIDIRSIDLSQPLSIKMVTTRDMSITFRPDCIDQQLMRLTSVFERFGNDQRTIHTVDLTPEQNVPITFYE
jgi:cell division septal protein FtsQ